MPDSLQPPLDHAPRVRRRVPLPLVTRNGETAIATAITFAGVEDGGEHLAIVLGGAAAVGPAAPPPRVRVHSECLTGDVFGSARCDCGAQLQEAIESMIRLGGIILYLRQEGRGIGLYNKLDAYELQDGGYDTFAANRELSFRDDQRDYSSAAAMLTALGISSIRLLTNNPDKATQLASRGISVLEVIPTGVYLTPHNVGYLSAKREYSGHFLPLSAPAEEAGR